jgi:hypothetical protein
MKQYWTLVYLTTFGERRVEIISEAQAFFQRVFLEQNDQMVQRQLVELARSSSDESDRILAEWCLRCAISHQIQLACCRLATKFGEKHRFCTHDLLIFVLDNVRPGRNTDSQPTDYQSLADRILQTFNPDQSSLSTWVDRLVKQRRDIHQFLLEQGVYLASDWGILNDTTIAQLQKILSEFYCRTDAEVRAACQLLRSYHAIYRQDRLKAKLQGRARGKCPPPTPEQQQRIARLLQTWGEPPLPSDELLDALTDMATGVRKYRLYIQAGKMSEELIDPDTLSSTAQNSFWETDEEEFLTRYRQQLLDCLDRSIVHVVNARVQAFENKKTPKARKNGQIKAQQFLKALQLFHDRGLPMGEIARELGIEHKQQYTVSRLLDLTGLRADVRHHTLQLLRDRLRHLAKDYTRYLDPERLQSLDRGLDDLLGEQIDQIIQQAKTRIEQKRPTDSIFAHRLCRYLDRRNAP